MHTISPSINDVALNEYQLQNTPGSSSIPFVSSHCGPFNSNIIQQGKVLLQVEHDSSAVNFSTHHVFDLSGASTGRNDEAWTPFTSGGELHADASIDMDNLDFTTIQHLLSFPIHSPDLDASATFDHFLNPEMLLPVAGQPSVQPDLPDQAINPPEEARRQQKWQKVVAVVKWKIMLSTVREKKKREEVSVSI